MGARPRATPFTETSAPGGFVAIVAWTICAAGAVGVVGVVGVVGATGTTGGGATATVGGGALGAVGTVGVPVGSGPFTAASTSVCTPPRSRNQVAAAPATLAKPQKLMRPRAIQIPARLFFGSGAGAV